MRGYRISDWIRAVCIYVGFFYGSSVVSQSYTCEAIESLEQEAVVEGLDGWLFDSFDFTSKFELGRSMPYVNRLAEALENRNIQLVMVLLPTRAMVNYQDFDPSKRVFSSYSLEAAITSYTTLLANLQKRGIIAPNLYQAVVDSGGQEEFFFKTDIHWRPTGADLVAQTVSNEIMNSFSGYGALSKTEFITETVQEEIQKGGKAQRIEDVCGGEIAPETFMKLRTIPKDPVGLFDETPPAEVVLLGTSMSNRGDRLSYNFAGFLSQRLSLNVLNAAVGAGGPLTSILAYFLSEDYLQSKPSIIVWEFPVWQMARAKAISEYRQIIPSIYGPCTEGLLEQTTELKPKLDLLVNNESLDIRGSDYYVYFKFSNITVAKFGVALVSQDGSEDVVEFDRSTRVANTGQFYVELSDTNSPYQQLHLSLPEDVQGTVEARLCQVPH